MATTNAATGKLTATIAVDSLDESGCAVDFGLVEAGELVRNVRAVGDRVVFDVSRTGWNWTTVRSAVAPAVSL